MAKRASKKAAAQPCEANGALIAAIAAALPKFIAAAQTLLPEILQIIALFGGNTPSPAQPSQATK